MMKNLYAIAAAAALVCSISSTANAQAGGGGIDESDDEEIMVSAQVCVPLRINRISDLDLGEVRRGGNTTVLASDPGAAEIVVIGDAGEDIELTYPQAPATVTLSHTDDDDADDLEVSLLCRTSMSDGGTSTAYNSGTGAQLSDDDGGDATMDGDGQRWFHFGGSVTASNDQARGTYNGSFEVSADYYP